MAVKTYIVVSATFIQGKHVPKDTLVELDDNDQQHAELLGMLNDAGRVKEFSNLTPEELAEYKARYKEQYGEEATDKTEKEAPEKVMKPVGIRAPRKSAKPDGEEKE